MMRLIRDKTGVVFVWFAVLAFVLLIVVEWGADFSSSGARRGSDNVGVINGEEVSLNRFQVALQNASRRQPNSQERNTERLVQEVWDSMVQTVLLDQEIERLGIEVSDEELAYFVRTQPPPEIQRLEIFQTDGQFDLVKYNQFINDPNTYKDANTKNFMLQIESLLQNQLLNFKLQRLVVESVQISPAEVRQRFVEENETLEADYVFVPVAQTQADSIEVTDAEIQAYYEEHTVDYSHPEQVKMAYVHFPLQPTADDSAKVAKEIQSLGQEIESGADFAELARALSDDPGSAAKGGDLGAFGRQAMVKSFSDAAFGLAAGQVSEPVLTPYGWHLIKVDEHLEENGEEKVKARHILLRFKPSRQTEEATRERAENFRAQAEATDFAAAAAAEGLEVKQGRYLKKGETEFSLGQNTGWLVNRFMGSELGSLSPVGGDDQSFWVAHLVERRPAGVMPLDEVRQQIEYQLRSDKRVALAAEALKPVRQQVDEGASFEAAVNAAGLELKQMTEFSRSSTVPDFRTSKSFANAAFRLEPGQVSSVVELTGGASLIRLQAKNSIDESTFETQKDQLTQQLRNERQSIVLNTWFTQLRQSAEIEDNRHEFYTF